MGFRGTNLQQPHNIRWGARGLRLPDIHSLLFLTWKNFLPELKDFAEVLSALHKGGCFIRKERKQRSG